MTKLDEIAVNVELVLISLIEGVALVTLGEQAFVALQDPEWYRYIIFIISGFLILLVFWTQSILHAVSFIRWPIRVEHMFLYFASALLQILAYSYLLNLAMWFFLWTLFSLVAMGMYFLDLWIIRDSEVSFSKLPGGADFLAQVEDRHLFEMKYLVPIALAFNIVLWLLVIAMPKLFQPVAIYVIPGVFQLLFSGFALYDCTKNFRIRSAMIAGLFSEHAVSSNRSDRRQQNRRPSASSPDSDDSSPQES